MNATPRMLVVDDNPAIIGCMRLIFAAPLYDVTAAGDGEDALAELDSQPKGYDIIIIDQKMPHMTGVELVEQIRQRGISGKIVVLSAHLSAEIRDAYQRMKVQIIMDKPFDIHELRFAVNELAYG